MASRKDPNGRPQISSITPPAAIPGGEFQIRGKAPNQIAATARDNRDVDAPIVVGSDST